MKANELMIGSLVECVDSTHKKKVYAKVCAIEEGQTSILVEKDKCNWFLNISLLKPIPLKRVHLTKNGFKAVDVEDTEFVYRDGYEIKVMIDQDIRDSIFLSINFPEKDLWMPLEYVHELQQAMRIMGCDKTIEL